VVSSRKLQQLQDASRLHPGLDVVQVSVHGRAADTSRIISGAGEPIVLECMWLYTLVRECAPLRSLHPNQPALHTVSMPLSPSCDRAVHDRRVPELPRRRRLQRCR
jgi:hypothetical protein